jgi:CRP/FNR family transcriptional regulator, cyclic AMP receptor protein
MIMAASVNDRTPRVRHGSVARNFQRFHVGPKVAYGQIPMRDTSNLARRAPDPGSSRFVSGAYPTPDVGRAEPLYRPPPSSERVPRPIHAAVGGQAEFDVESELRAIPALAELPREMLVEVAASAIQQRLRAGVVLVEQGATATHLAVLVRGSVKVVRTTRHALGESTVVLEVARAPAILLGTAFFDAQPEMASAVTLRACHVIALDRRAVLRLAAQHSAFGRALLAHLAQSVRRHVRRIDEVASGPVDERVRHLLEGLAQDHGTPFGQGRFIAIPLRRRDIACMVNATTETVSRVLARFEREGLTRSTRDGIWLKLPSPSLRPAAAEEPSDGQAAVARGFR